VPAQDAASAVVIAAQSDVGLAQPARASLNALIDVTAVQHGRHPEGLDPAQPCRPKPNSAGVCSAHYDQQLWNELVSLRFAEALSGAVREPG
jgi:hypothetical protein